MGRLTSTCIEKCRRDIPIIGRYITTSTLWKQTAAKLEFYSRFRFLRLRHHRHVLLHLPTKFRPNWTIRGRVMMSYPFFKMAARPRHRISISVFVISLICEGRNLPAHQISATYLNPQLRYYYFRFLKTNVRHVGILFPVRIFTFASPSVCHFTSVYQISSKSVGPSATELWSHIVILTFQDGGRQPYWIISRLLQTTHEV